MGEWDDFLNDLKTLRSDIQGQAWAKGESDLGKVILYTIVREIGIAEGYAFGATNTKH